MKEKSIDNRILAAIYYFIICLFTLVASILKIFFGWNADESYAIVVSEKLRTGSLLFVDLWDSHQTGLILSAFLLKMYVFIKGNLEAAGLFLRISATIMQTVLSIAVFVQLKRYYSKYVAFSASITVACLLPPTILCINYGFCTMMALIFALLLYLKVYMKDSENPFVSMFIAGALFAISVFSYPTMLISFPVMIAGIFIINSDLNQKRICLLGFNVGVLLIFLIFCGYVIHSMSLDAFLYSLEEIVGKAGDHSGFFAVTRRPDVVMKSCARIFVASFVSIAIYMLLRKKLNTRIFICYIVMMLPVLVVIGLNVTGIRPSGPAGFLERYILCVIWGIFFIRNNKDKFANLLYIVGIVYYIGSLMASNLFLNENAVYLECSIIAVVMLASRYAEKITDKFGKIFARTSIAIFMFGMIFSKGYFVAVDGGGPANIFQHTTRIQNGVLKDIYVSKVECEEYEGKKAELERTTVMGHSYLYVGNDAMSCLSLNGQYNAPQYAATTVLNSQWIDYFTKGKHELPQYIYIDKSTYTIESFECTDFGRFVSRQYKEYDKKLNYFIVMSRITL